MRTTWFHEPRKYGKNVARIAVLMEKFDTYDLTRIFNLNELGFYLRDMMVYRLKYMARRGERGKTREIQFRGTWDHVTLVQVMWAAGQIMTLLVVMPEVEARYREQPNGKYESASDYLPKSNYLHMRPIFGVNNNMFYALAKGFVEKNGVFACRWV